MFKKLKSLFLILFITSFTFCYAAVKKETPAAQEPKKEQEIDVNKVSQAFGHLIGKNLETLGFEFDMQEVIKGLQDSLAGKDSPMDEAECVQAISIVQEEAFQKLADKNLSQANEFLSSNVKNQGVVELEKNKLQYRVEKLGNGAVVEGHHTPMIRYTGKFLDGKVFGASQEDELISLDETIPGFSKGIIGMKEGEKRTIFIHPELGYGMTGYLPPNSLLVFDIEVVKANATPDQEESLTSIHSSEVDAQEIADPGPMKEKGLR